jgi:hypothetical protein
MAAAVVEHALGRRKVEVGLGVPGHLALKLLRSHGGTSTA